MSAEAYQVETKEQKERLQEKEKGKHNQEVRNKIHKEYAAALDHEGMHKQRFSSFIYITIYLIVVLTYCEIYVDNKSGSV